MLSLRNTLYRKYKRSKLPSDLEKYRKVKEDAWQLIESSNQASYQERLTKINNSALLWKELRNLGLARKRTTPSPNFSIDKLNAHFSRISTNPDSPPLASYL